MVVRLLRQTIKSRPGMLASIVAMDSVSAICRIASVLLIAAAVGLFTSKSGADLFGYHIDVSLSLRAIILFGIVIGLCTFSGAVASYGSTRMSRRLGRWLNERSMDELYDIMAKSPPEIAAARFEQTANLNTVLTQVPMHTGLAAETVSRIIHPLIMIVFAGLTLLYQQPGPSLVAFAGIGLFLPVLVATNALIHRNAQSFYSATAMVFGKGVSTLITRATSQYGISNKRFNTQNTISNLPFISDFFDSFDTNHLGNERVGLVVAIMDALLRPILFVGLGTLVFYGEFTLQETIEFLGSLAYLFGSARNVSSLVTNLVRFHPQVQPYFDFLDSGVTSRNGHELSLDFPAEGLKIPHAQSGAGEFPLAVKPGEIVLIKSSIPLSTLTLGELLPAILGSAAADAAVLDRLRFVAGAFRFSDVPIMEQLCASARTPDREQLAGLFCERLGAAKCIERLPEGYDTRMNESVWNSLDAAARAALRLVPLAIDRMPTISIIDVGAIQSIGMAAMPVLHSEFSESILFLFVHDSTTVPDYHAHHYLAYSRPAGVTSGNKEWFQTVMADGQPASSDSGIELVIAATVM